MKKFLLGTLLLMACSRAEVPSSVSLVSEVKRALAERERRLTSFKLVVESTEGENRARHEIMFRSPNKSRGRMTSPKDFELAFDGTTLVRLLHEEKKYEVVSLEMPPAERAFFLASQFMPFVPEGYRSPLLPQSGVEAKPVTRPDEAQVVELTVKPGEQVTVVYVLRMPSGDFLEKRTLATDQVRTLRMEAEQCDAALKLCVPTKLVERWGEETLGTTAVTSVMLNAALPQGTFSPGMPEGWSK